MDSLSSENVTRTNRPVLYQHSPVRASDIMDQTTSLLDGKSKDNAVSDSR